MIFVKRSIMWGKGFQKKTSFDGRKLAAHGLVFEEFYPPHGDWRLVAAEVGFLYVGIIQEFITGTRYYLHYFYSPIRDEGYTLSKGSLELLSMDRRVESNADEIFRLGSPRELIESGIRPTYVVTGNVPLVARESLLPLIFSLGERVVEESLGLFGGMIGAFCLETVFTDELEIKVFEISARIVAGTNLYTSGSPYSDFIEENMSTGRRIAREIKLAAAAGKLDEIIS